jgi:hypothetical protein
MGRLPKRESKRAHGIPDAQEIYVNGLRIFEHPALFKRESSLITVLQQFTD